MEYSAETLWCAGCGAEIFWGPYISHGHKYCCQDCSQGIRCGCGERQEWEDDRQKTASLTGSTVFDLSRVFNA